MPATWNQSELLRHIIDGVEKSLTLDYKAGDALGMSDGKKNEITKDVSAMANSAGGTIIYGIEEYDEEETKHLPAKFAPIDRRQFSKEWLEQVINTIQPRISGIIIHPVELSTGFNDVAYIVEIPQSTTAHQAKDFRYYRRFNFESVPMNDYEVRDVMNRLTLPDVDVNFTYTKSFPDGINPEYRLGIVAQNQGVRLVERYKLVFNFPSLGNHVRLRDLPGRNNPDYEFYGFTRLPDDDGYRITVKSKSGLFPKEIFNIGNVVALRYSIDTTLHYELLTRKHAGNEITMSWILYADGMPPKRGEIPFSKLYDSDK